MLKRFGRAGLAVVALVLGACGDSTTPNTVTPAQLARHIDSLSVATDTGVGGPQRAAILEELEIPPALGAAPVPVQVTTAHGQQTWQGFVYKNVGSGSSDSVYFLVAYNDYALDAVVSAELAYVQNGTLLTVFLLDSGQVVIGGQGSLVAATTSAGGACVLAKGLKNPIGVLATGCELANFQASFTFAFTSGPTIGFPSQSFNGVWVK